MAIIDSKEFVIELDAQVQMHYRKDDLEKLCLLSAAVSFTPTAAPSRSPILSGWRGLW